MGLSAELLRTLVGVQAATLAVLFVFLLLNRLFQDLVSRRRRRWATRAERVIRRWVVGRSQAGELVEVLADAPLTSVREALETTWSDLLEEDRGRIREAVRRPRWTRRLLRASRSLFWWRRVDAAQVTAYLGTRENVDVLASLLEDRHMAVRVAASFAARDLELPSLLNPLIRQFLKAGPPRRRALADAVVTFGDEAVAPVARALEGEREASRRSVLLALAGRLADRVEAPDLFEPVLEAAETPDLEVRIQATKALAAFPDPRALRMLRERLGDPAWEVRAQAAKGIGQLRIGTEEVRRELAGALGDENWWVRLRAAVALRQSGRAGVELLESVDAGRDPYAHDMAQYVLRLEDEALTEVAA